MAGTRTTTPTPTPVQAWSTVAGWVVTVAVFVGWVWLKAPARALWAVKGVRVVAWLFLAPVAWWLFRTAVRCGWVVLRWLIVPVVAVLWTRVSARPDVRDAVKAMRKGRKRGRKSGKRIARQIYGVSAVA
ncbi:hypothetical protein [Streptomyces violaceusniger]|uniref:Uncharacterized protein n=1 Tax=Streptomyces violaceusniger (strain Tu 4113) TaxID=653045 RepID=G2PHN6_STRV4|nr:hypothetical protein [Streptomyces violaceusniger]AEM88837.1 hypothetical protein Strvi_0061 [Streptomyces violaceusniger Tu 4113]